MNELLKPTIAHNPLDEWEETKVWRMGFSLTGGRDWVSGHELAFEDKSLALVFYGAASKKFAGASGIIDDGGPQEVTLSDAFQWAKSLNCKELWIYSTPYKWQEYPV